MGADVIIGVDLGTSDLKTLDKLNSPGDVIGQIIALHGHDKYARNKEQTDLLLRPNMTSYNAASFSTVALDTLIRRGEQEAYAHWDEIIALKEKIGIAEDSCPEEHGHVRKSYPALPTDSFYIRTISFVGTDPRDEKWLMKISGLRENSRITLHELHHAMSVLIGSNAYSNVDYMLTGEQQQNLVLTGTKEISQLCEPGCAFRFGRGHRRLGDATFDHRPATIRSWDLPGVSGGRLRLPAWIMPSKGTFAQPEPGLPVHLPGSGYLQERR